MSSLRIGCAGWHYADWAGRVYPPRLPTSKWLHAYTNLFPFVEVDATFYRLPSEETVQGWIERTRDAPDFTFAAKVPQEATHRALPVGDVAGAVAAAGAFVDRIARPIERAGRFEAALAQLPPSFTAREGLDGLLALVDALEPRERRVAVEFRHASWLAPGRARHLPHVEEALSARGVAIAQVDGLGSRFNATSTAPWTYFRLHGRRDRIPPEERGLPHAPYDYLYSREEIRSLAREIEPVADRSERTLVVFNNHYRGKGPRNAIELMEALGRPRPDATIRTGADAKLSDFATESE